MWLVKWGGGGGWVGDGGERVWDGGAWRLCGQQGLAESL
jgi:hypothetical protein